MGSFLFCLAIVICNLFNGLYLWAAADDDKYSESDKSVIIEKIIRLLEAEYEAGGFYEASEKEGNVSANESMEGILEHFHYLLEHPLNINACSRSQLEELVLLSAFQIESILEYRRTGGDILSASQLELLYGFDIKSVNLLKPFLSFEPAGSVLSGNKKVKSQLFFKIERGMEKDDMYSPIAPEQLAQNPNSRYLGTPYHFQTKYKGIYNNRWQVGFTLENDAGEYFFASGAPPVDFFSFHLAAKNINSIDLLVIGDFSVRFGQGLTIWNTFSLNGVSAPMGIYKRGAAFAPYSSANESNFCRGIASSFSFGRFDVNAFISSNRLDAKVKDSEYLSVMDDGLHNTFNTFSNRKTLKEGMAGVNLSYRANRIKIGVSAVAYKYNKRNGRKVYEYNRYQMYDGIYGNISTDFYTIIKGMKLFGEVAVDYGGCMALLLGTVFNAGDNIEMSVLARNYSKGYIAPHAGAYSTISSVANQNGILFNAVYSSSGNLKFILNSEYCHYPWKRYNVDRASSIFKVSLTGEYSVGKITALLRFVERYNSFPASNKINSRLQLILSANKRLAVKLHSYCSFMKRNVGWQIGSNVKYETLRKSISVQVGGGFFSAPDWNDRLYIYEPDMPYTFNSRLLYGTGYNIYALARFRVYRGAEIYLKGDTIQYIRKEKDPKSNVKLAFRVNF